MQKLLENKWGKLLLIVALSFVFMIIDIILVVNAGGRCDYALGAISVYIALPVLYMTVVLFNYLRFALFKLVRWALFVAAGILALIGVLFLLIGPFAFNTGYGEGLLEDGTSMWQCFVCGAGLGSMITYTILYYDFEKLGYRPENAEKRNWKTNLIFYSVIYLGGLLAGGVLLLILKAIKMDWLLIIAFIALALFTVGSIFKSIREYGLPLGGSKEWDEWLDKHHTSYSSGSYPLPAEPSESDIRDMCERAYYDAQGCACSIGRAKVEKVGDREFKIRLSFEYRNSSHMTDESYKDPKNQMWCRDQVVSQIQSSLNATGIGYELEEG